MTIRLQMVNLMLDCIIFGLGIGTQINIVRIGSYQWFLKKYIVKYELLYRRNSASKLYEFDQLSKPLSKKEVKEFFRAETLMN